MTRPSTKELGFKRGSQNYRIYNQLLCRPITNTEIVHDMRILNSTGRIADIRSKLKPYLVDIEAKRLFDTGVFTYKLKG